MQTTFCLSASALGTLMLLFMGLLAATSQLGSSSQRISSQMVPMPKITMALQQGPWPKCIGMSGRDCVEYIEGNAKDVNVVLVREGAIVTEDFKTDRVRVWVGRDGTVSNAPARG